MKKLQQCIPASVGLFPFFTTQTLFPDVTFFRGYCRRSRTKIYRQTAPQLCTIWPEIRRTARLEQAFQPLRLPHILGTPCLSTPQCIAASCMGIH